VLLDSVATRLNPVASGAKAGDESSGAVSKLALIAVDRRRRPAIYSEIEEEYLGKTGGRGQVARFPELRHITEKYRLACEYILLAPRWSRAPDAYEVRAGSALANPASIITFVQVYRYTTASGVEFNHNRKDLQLTLLTLLSRFQNETGLSAIIECMAMSEKQQTALKTGVEGWDVRGTVRSVLSNPYDPHAPNHWREVIAQYTKRHKLGKNEQAILAEVNPR